jgi:hypothetical protein
MKSGMVGNVVDNVAHAGEAIGRSTCRNAAETMAGSALLGNLSIRVDYSDEMKENELGGTRGILDDETCV